MTSKDFVSDATEGFVSATAKLGIEGIKKLVEKFRNRKIAFVQDEKTIERVREELTSNELKFYKAYLENTEILTQIVMGLTLRRLEEEKDFERLEKLRAKILSKYDIEGVHIAQSVQSGIVTRYMTYLIEMRSSEDLLKKKLMGFLENIENHVCFIKFNMDENKEVNKILTKINSNSPDVFVISGMGGAVDNTEKIIKSLDDYNLENYFREDYLRKNRRISFFHRVLSKD